MGVSILLVLFLIFIWRIFHIGFNAQNNFFRVFCLGFGILVCSQIFINIGMNLGLLPVIGISLPLVSYGGSSLLMCFIGLGIIQSFQ
jgi:cell division protein FtsW (lipid II flippase)